MMNGVLVVLWSLFAQWIIITLICALILTSMLSLDSTSSALYGAMIATVPIILEVHYYFGEGMAMTVLLSSLVAFIFFWKAHHRKKRK